MNENMEIKKFDADEHNVTAETFSRIYPLVNSYIMKNTPLQESRDGDVYEILDVKTHILNPYRRCVGGYGRNINVFFLLAEAMWIFVGRKDVEFLKIFNENMVKYSDDSFTFHAPYGFRIRHWGEPSELCKNVNAFCGFDQLREVLRVLDENPNTRQAVISIWNPLLDLGVSTKDMPCNDMLMFKIRDKKLITTIQNRSNDLHFGLPTNIFQFSFMTELMSQCLNVELGTQTHNSQSLHIYTWNNAAKTMLEGFDNGDVKDLYDVAEHRRLCCDFFSGTATNKLKEVDEALNCIISNLMLYYKHGGVDVEGENMVKRFSLYLWDVYCLLKLYIEYKKTLENVVSEKKRDDVRFECIERIYNDVNFNFLVEGQEAKFWDISVLAMNFFAARVKTRTMKNHVLLTFDKIGNVLGKL